MKTFSPQQSGFSLVETLVAITILLLVIVGPMTISTNTARSTSYSSEQVVAFFLAQEGVELVQKARDDLILKNFDDATANPAQWAEFTDDVVGGAVDGEFVSCYAPDGCGVELLRNDTDGALISPLKDCSTFSNCRLYFDPNGVRSHYTHTNTGDETPFTRVIRMNNISASEVEVTATVYWQAESQRRLQEVSVQTYLFDVYGN